MAVSQINMRIRIWVYILSMSLHICNIIFISRTGRPDLANAENISVFKDMRFRFFTSWTFVLQTVYSIFSLACDLITLRNSNKKDFVLPQIINDVREFIFASLVWPSTLLVFSVFWSLYFYDRSLIFPDYLDDIIPPISNHIMHTLIIPMVLVEVIFRPRTEPANHARNVMQLSMHMMAYFSVMMFTYMEKGVWLYPIFKKLHGTVYFWIVILIMTTMMYSFYYIQWPITNFIHGKKNKMAASKNVTKKAGTKKNR